MKLFCAVNRTRPSQRGAYNLQLISACVERVWPHETKNDTDNTVEINEKDGHIFPSRKTEDEILRIDCARPNKEEQKLLKLSLKRLSGEDELVKDIDWAFHPSMPSPVKSKHVTGSARSEGYNKIDSVDKKTYLRDSLPSLLPLLEEREAA